jgi:hypothetical protein
MFLKISSLVGTCVQRNFIPKSLVVLLLAVKTAVTYLYSLLQMQLSFSSENLNMFKLEILMEFILYLITLFYIGVIPFLSLGICRIVITFVVAMKDRNFLIYPTFVLLVAFQLVTMQDEVTFAIGLILILSTCAFGCYRFNYLYLNKTLLEVQLHYDAFYYSILPWWCHTMLLFNLSFLCPTFVYTYFMYLNSLILFGIYTTSVISYEIFKCALHTPFCVVPDIDQYFTILAMVFCEEVVKKQPYMMLLFVVTESFLKGINHGAKGAIINCFLHLTFSMCPYLIVSIFVHFIYNIFMKNIGHYEYMCSLLDEMDGFFGNDQPATVVAPPAPAVRVPEPPVERNMFDESEELVGTTYGNEASMRLISRYVPCENWHLYTNCKQNETDPSILMFKHDLKDGTSFINMRKNMDFASLEEYMRKHNVPPEIATRHFKYQDYMVNKIAKCAIKGTRVTNRGPKDEPDEIEKVKIVKTHNFVETTTHHAYKTGEFVEKWNITNFADDYRGPRGYLKKVPFNSQSFKIWFNTKILSLKHLCTKPTDYITANKPCQILYYRYNSLKKDLLEDYWNKADIYLMNYSVESLKTPGFNYCDALDMPLRRSIKIASLLLYTPAQLRVYEKDFVKNKSLFNFAMKYLEGEEGIEITKLQKSIDLKLSHVQPRSMIQLQMMSTAKSYISSAAGVVKSLSIPIAIDVQPVKHEIQVPPLNINHRIDFGIGEIINSLTVPSDQEFVRNSICFGSMLTAFFTSTNATNALSIIVQYVSSNKYLFSKVSELLAHLRSFTIMQDSTSGFISSCKEYLAELFVSCGLYGVFHTLGEGFTDIFMPGTAIITSNLRLALVKEAASGVAKLIISTLNDLFQRILECVKTKSLNPLWGRDWNPTLIYNELTNLIDYYTILTCVGDKPNNIQLIDKLRIEGKIGKEWTGAVTIELYSMRVRNLIQKATSIKTVYYKDIQITNRLTGLIIRAEQFLSALSLMTTMASARSSPYALFMYGDPGVGKTNMVNLLLGAIARKKNYDFDNGIYNIQPHNNFQDGLDHKTWAIIADDIDHSPNAPGSFSNADWVVQIVNNTPMSVEQAAVEMKGKVFVAPAVFVYTSNFKFGRFNHVSYEPSSCYRRFTHHVTVEVKKEFCIVGTPKLDHQKAKDAGHLDLWILTVGKISDDAKIVDEKIYSFYEFVVLVQSEMVEHLQLETYLLYQKMARNGSCAFCGLAMLPCYCAEAVKERESQSEFVYDVEGEEELINSGLSLDMIDFHPKPIEEPDLELQCRREGGQCQRFKSKLRSVLGFPDNFTKDDLLYYISRYERQLLTGFVLTAASLSLMYYVSRKILRQTYISYQERLLNKTDNGLIPNNWFRAEQTFTPALPTAGFGTSTFTLDDIQNSVMHSSYKIDNGTSSVLGVAISTNVILTVAHIVEHEGNFYEKLTISRDGFSTEVKISKDNFYVLPISEQLAVITVPGLKGVAVGKKFWLGIDDSIVQFDEIKIMGPDGVHYAPSFNTSVMIGTRRNITTNAITKAGDCGLVYVARLGSSWKIIGMHYGLQNVVGSLIVASKQNSLGEMTTQRELIQGTQHLCATFQSCEYIKSTITKVPKELRFGHFAVQSTIWAAQSHHQVNVYPVGHIEPPKHLSNNKSKVKNSILHDDLAELEKEYCGKVNYFTLPVFKGSMVGDKWVDAYTNMWQTQNFKPLPAETTMIALYDYLMGIDQLDLSGYSSISEQQAIRGIPGSTINAMVLKTSTGPPYDTSKRNHFAVDYETDLCYLSPEMSSIADEIEATLERDEVPIVMCICSLKDEPVKDNKMPRVFNCLPASFNLVSKKKHSGWKTLMRNNIGFFESAVGINMTSRECNKIINVLKLIDPTLTNLYDGDIKAMDKSWSPDLFDWVAKIVYAMSFAIGGESRKCYLLVLALKHILYQVRGDAAHFFTNPSGNDVTVEINGLAISLLERIVYYTEHPFTGDKERVREWYRNFFSQPIPEECPDMNFRTHVSLVHYGDDNLKAMRFAPSVNYLNHWKELGFIMTDASKSSVFEKKNISEVSFLQRDFVFDEELQSYIPPLKKKSLIRMLLMKKESVLSDQDHAAVVITEALKECVYHGRAYYEEMYTLLMKLTIKYELNNNSYLDLRSFDAWREEVKDNTFQTWSTRPKPTLVAVTPDFQLQMSNNVTLVESANEQNAETRSKEVASVIANTTLLTTEEHITRAIPRNVTYVQTLPKTNLDDFLTRAVKIYQYSILPGNVLVSPIAFDPWAYFLANAQVADKTKNYTYIRGTIQVVGVVTCSPNAYGLGYVSCLPQARYSEYGGTAIAPALRYPNVQGVDYWHQVDYSKCGDFAFQLPWCYNREWCPIATGCSNLWNIYITEFSNIASAIPSGVASGTITFYASLIDYELSVPMYQSKKHLTPNSALKNVAPKLHGMIGEGKGSQTLQTIGKAIEPFSKIPIIGSTVSMVSNALEMGATVLDWFGFTRTNSYVMPQPFFARALANVAHLDNHGCENKSTFNVENELSIDPSLTGFGSDDCFANDNFLDRWTFLTLGGWNQTMLTGDDVFSRAIPITPSYCDSAAAPSFHPNTATYFGLPFSYWRGDMMYKIIIPANNSMKGTLQFYWQPVNSTTVIDPTNITFNYIYNVETCRDIEITIGYANNELYLFNTLITDSLAIWPVGSINGFLRCKVVNPLVATNSLSAVDVIVFVKPGKNLQFFGPRTSIKYIDSLLAPHTYILDDITLQSGLNEVSTSESVVEVELVPSCGVFPIDTMCAGEPMQCIRGLLQKPSLLPTQHYPANQIINQNYLYAPTDATVPYHFTWARWFISCFVGVAADERYQVMCSPGDQRWAIGFARTDDRNADTNISTLASMNLIGSGQEAIVPYYQPYRFIPCFTKVPYGHAKTSIYTATGTTDSTIDLALYYSLSNVRGTMFRQLPLLLPVVRTSTDFMF